MPEFLLPDLGEGLTEAEIVRWLVSVGETITVDQPVVEVETAKAAVEVPSPFAGEVTALHGAAGTTLPVGAPLLSVGGVAPGFTEPGVVVPEPAPENPANAGSAGNPASSESEESGNVLIGYGTSTATRSNRRRRTARAGRQRAAATTSPSATATNPSTTTSTAVISPIVRRLAKENNVDLASVSGSGPRGVIRRCDVEREIAGRSGSGEGRRIPLKGLRKTVADKLATSRREIPEATVWVDVDATGLLAARDQLDGVGLLALLARFTVAGLKKFPELNSRVERDDIVVLDAIHLGFAAQTERGLVVPVIRDAHTMNTRALSEALRDRTAAARAGQLTPADLTGGTFTVNNYGVFGVDGSAAIINHPEAAILGLGRIIDRPWVVDGTLVVRKVSQLTLAFDHRVCDGGTAGGFLRFVADCVESPVTALADL